MFIEGGAYPLAGTSSTDIYLNINFDRIKWPNIDDDGEIISNKTKINRIKCMSKTFNHNQEKQTKTRENNLF